MDEEKTPPEWLENKFQEPSEEEPEEKPTQDVLQTPWDKRRTLGIIEAFIDSWRLLLFQPSRFFERLSASGGFGEPLSFFIAFCVILTIFSFPSNLISAYLIQMLIPNFIEFVNVGPVQDFYDRLPAQMPNWQQVIFDQLCCTVVNPFAWIISLFVVSAIYAVIGLFFAGKIEYEMIFRIICFSEIAKSTYIINPIPMLRELVFIIHWIILLTLGFKYVGQMSGEKALMFALLPIILAIGFLCCCYYKFIMPEFG